MNIELLKVIAAATAAGQVVYVSPDDGMPLVKNTPPLIEVDVGNKDPKDANKVAAKITDAGVKMLAESNQAQAGKTASNVAIASGFVRPKAKRTGGGGSGAPTKYPFDGLQIDQHFFIADAEVASGDAYKTLGSAVGSANQRYSEGTGVMKTVTRAKRGPDHKTIKGADGKNEMETVQVEERKALRKFVVSDVEAGKEYGSYKAPANGAVVLRVAV